MERAEMETTLTTMFPTAMMRKARFKDRFLMDQCNRRNLPENYSLAFWEEHLQQHPFFSRVVVQDNQVVAYVLCDGGSILSLAVDLAFRRHHWGTQLIQELQTQCERLSLQVRHSNQGARSLYEKMGFVIQEELKNYYQNPAEDAWVMTWSRII
jgi:ribosomal protein S18 acetylase RimI-like enzyme